MIGQKNREKEGSLGEKDRRILEGREFQEGVSVQQY